MKQVIKPVAYIVGKAVVKLHYGGYLDIYALCSQHDPERWARGQNKAKIPASVRWKVWYRDNYTCVYCTAQGIRLSLDHVIPEAHGGKSEPDNLVSTCIKCNNRKGSRDFERFINGAWLKKRRQTIRRLSSTTKVRKQPQSPQMQEMLSRIASATGDKNSSTDTV